LPAASEGMPATYEINGRQFIVLPVASGTGQFAARFGGPGPAAGRGADGAPPAAGQGRSAAAPPAAVPGDPPEQQAAARQGGGGRAGRGGAVGPPGQYMVLTLKR
jgi:hypothetical protein